MILDDVRSVLVADTTLAGLLTGGLYADVPEISRQFTPNAFDTNKEIKPCGLLRGSNEIPNGPYEDGVQLPVNLYLYQHSGFDVMELVEARVFVLLNRKKIAVAAVWEFMLDSVIYRQWEDALACSMMMARYICTRRKA